MVKLRLRRMGAKKKPFYRIVAADSKAPRDGKVIAVLGYYNPIEHPAVVEIDEEKALYWLKRGAIPTDTVRSLLRRQGILRRLHEDREGMLEEIPENLLEDVEEEPLFHEVPLDEEDSSAAVEDEGPQ